MILLGHPDGVALHDGDATISIEREAMDELRPAGDYAVFARAGYTGVHGVAQI